MKLLLTLKHCRVACVSESSHWSVTSVVIIFSPKLMIQQRVNSLLSFAEVLVREKFHVYCYCNLISITKRVLYQIVRIWLAYDTCNSPFPVVLHFIYVTLRVTGEVKASNIDSAWL
jgi:hypothetical protein